MRSLLRRFWHAFEWGFCLGWEAFFSGFARAWLTGDGRKRAVVAAPERPAAAGPARTGMGGGAQPTMGEAQIIGGLKQLGYSPEQARRGAARALASGEREPSALMRRALAEVRA